MSDVKTSRLSEQELRQMRASVGGFIRSRGEVGATTADLYAGWVLRLAAEIDALRADIAQAREDGRREGAEQVAELVEGWHSHARISDAIAANVHAMPYEKQAEWMAAWNDGHRG
jgi:hypothetical protein